MRKVILIGSAAYSGSTMLDLMLSNAPDGFSCGEVYALFRPWRLHHLHPACACGRPSCELWQSWRRSDECDLYRTIFATLPDRTYLVDSSKDLLWYRDRLSAAAGGEFELVHILLWKTPLDYAHSCWRRGGVRNWSARWADTYATYLSLIPSWVSVPYRDLAQRPADVLAELCERIGLQYRPGMELFWNGAFHTLFGSDSVRAHLLRPGTEEFARLQRKRSAAKPNAAPEEMGEFRHHRSFYYDSASPDRLPAEVVAQGAADGRLERIGRVLELTDFRRSADWEEVEELLANVSPPPFWVAKHGAIQQARRVLVKMGIDPRF